MRTPVTFSGCEYSQSTTYCDRDIKSEYINIQVLLTNISLFSKD